MMRYSTTTLVGMTINKESIWTANGCIWIPHNETSSIRVVIFCSFTLYKTTPFNTCCLKNGRTPYSKSTSIVSGFTWYEFCVFKTRKLLRRSNFYSTSTKIIFCYCYALLKESISYSNISYSLDIDSTTSLWICFAWIKLTFNNSKSDSTACL